MKILNFKENLRRIEKIKAMQDVKNNLLKFISIDTWVNSDDKSTCFADYLDKTLNNISEKSLVLVDDVMIASSNLYLPTEPLYILSKQAIKPFLECYDDAEWIQNYTEVISANEAYLIDTIDNTAFQDFLQCYKIMSIEDMIERYKNQKWFTGNKHG